MVTFGPVQVVASPEFVTFVLVVVALLVLAALTYAAVRFTRAALSPSKTERATTAGGSDRPQADQPPQGPAGATDRDGNDDGPDRDADGPGVA